MSDKLSSAFLSDGIDPNNMGPATATATGTTMMTAISSGATTTPTAPMGPNPTTLPEDYFRGDTATHIPGWGIALIVIAVVLILAAGWVIHTRVRWGYWGVGLKRVELRGRDRCATCGHVTWGGTAACARCQVVRGRQPLEMIQRPERAATRDGDVDEADTAADGYYGYYSRQALRREARAREREAAGVPPAGRDPRKGRFRNYTDTVVERMYVPFI